MDSNKQVTRSPGRRGLVRGAMVASCAVALATAGAVPASASAPASRTVNYVALGDSYAAGPGIPTQVDTTCARSDQNYPSLLATAKSWQLTDVTCSGATTTALAGPQGSKPPQLDALGADTDVVTLTIGGNDIGFSSNLATCARLTSSDPTGNPCKTFFTSGGTDQLEQRVNDTAPKIAAAVDAIKQKAPRAKVLVVGYPDLFPEDGVGCTSSAMPLAAGDFAYLRDTEKKLNAMLASQASANGAGYVDTYTPTIGHDMCKPAGERWIEPLVAPAPAASAHPNAQGQQAMATAVEHAIHCVPYRRR
ncbi:SGNH/GDSL hydrolase family protein [Streptomyces sp. NBC_00878]|uniref:SGNH/GDSL hydrolase family protein n=1 Tax=Streptomyces sp. NBC_00878 TaxID=2975854 RepID=UPI002259638F|nr:SGNH/GDSL hydrolase family protein [Streptomyces sp. NBC_00878]MCX4911142.1 SGNH/GDSL hydrolase family protein [Streptomyces sp. NBC_00878]